MLRRNILIFHLGALGDFLVTLPLAMGLARIHPQSRIIYITHQQKGKLAERLLGVESVDIESGWHHLYGDAAQLPAPATKLLAGAHSVYSFIAGDADTWGAQVRRISDGVDLCCLRPTPPADYAAAHATDYIVSQLEGRKAAAEAMRQMVRSIEDRGLARTPLRAEGPIAIHPGSGCPEKCWSAASYLELIGQMRSAGRRVRVILGEVELERWPAGQVEAFASAAEVCRPATCLELAASLGDASAYIGNDSGPSHLAGMLGLPTLVLFGPTSPATWRPLGPRVATLQKSPLESLPLDEVLARLQARPFGPAISG